VREGRGRVRGLVGPDFGSQRRGGWLGFDPWQELRHGLDRTRPDVKIVMGQVTCGIFGL
jgi:hypothetical protein